MSTCKEFLVAVAATLTVFFVNGITVYVDKPLFKGISKLGYITAENLHNGGKYVYSKLGGKSSSERLSPYVEKPLSPPCDEQIPASPYVEKPLSPPCDEQIPASSHVEKPLSPPCDEQIPASSYVVQPTAPPYGDPPPYATVQS